MSPETNFVGKLSSTAFDCANKRPGALVMGADMLLQIEWLWVGENTKKHANSLRREKIKK